MSRLLARAVAAALILAVAGGGPAWAAQGRWLGLFFQRPKLVSGPPVVTGSPFVDTVDHPAEGDFALLLALGVVRGSREPEGLMAHPDEAVTRGELAAVAVRLLGYEQVADWYKDQALPFEDAADIPAWAAGYARAASKLGLIRGLPGRDRPRFEALRKVTMGEAVTVLARAVEMDAGGSWPESEREALRAALAARLGEREAGAVITRADLAVLAAAALRAGRYSAAAGDVDPGDTLLSSVFGVVEGTVTEVDAAERRMYVRPAGQAQAQRSYLAPQVFLRGAFSLAGLVGERVLAVLRDGVVVFIEVRGDLRGGDGSR